MRRNGERTNFVPVLIGALLAAACASPQNLQNSVTVGSPVRQLDHLMVLTPHHDRLVAFLTDTLRLPVVWPAPGAPFGFSTGIALGDINLEFIPRPQATETRFTNLAFQPSDLATAPSELRRLGLHPLEPSVEVTDAGARRWTVVGFRQTFSGPGFFLIQYHAFEVDERRERFAEIQRSRDGGPLGLRRVREIRLVYQPTEIVAARDSWAQLVGLSALAMADEFQPPSGPRIRVIAGPDGPSNSLLVEVKSLSIAVTAARSLELLAFASSDSLVLDPVRLGGLRITLVEADDDLRIERPAYTGIGPRVLFDAAHFNVHTATERSQRLAALLRADGYRVEPNDLPFDRGQLAQASVLIVVSAMGANRDSTPELAGRPAFTPREVDSVHAWVKRGGALLLIVDHEPTGLANAGLALRFGVAFADGWVEDPDSTNHWAGCSSCLRYTRANRLIGAHPIMEGRDSSERVRGVISAVGQSLASPPGAAAVLRLSPTAVDIRGKDTTSAADRSQGAAFRFGKGRVVVLGEAAMLAGQPAPRPDSPFRRWWSQDPGIDNRQFALNIVRWLSGALQASGGAP